MISANVRADIINMADITTTDIDDIAIKDHWPIPILFMRF